MDLLPLVQFGLKHGAQLKAMLASGTSGDSHMLPDFVDANVPVLKKHWPGLNENGLLDDAATALRQALAPGATAQATPRDQAQGDH